MARPGPADGILHPFRVDAVNEARLLIGGMDVAARTAVFSENITTALSLARRIESGICQINGATVQDEAQMPFGDNKASGGGQIGGMSGVAGFTDLRWISIATQHRHYPI
jgi:vanillin dehydrogenase